MSVTGQRVLWGSLGGGLGALAGWESGLKLAGTEGLLGLALGAAMGVLLAPQLSHALPAFGIVAGPALTLTLMNLQRFTTNENATPPPVTRRGASMDAPLPSLGYLSTAIGVVTSALLAAVLLYEVGRRVRGERHPLRQSFKSLGWTCFWITLLMILISNFAPS